MSYVPIVPLSTSIQIWRSLIGKIIALRMGLFRKISQKRNLSLVIPFNSFLESFFLALFRIKRVKLADCGRLKYDTIWTFKEKGKVRKKYGPFIKLKKSVILKGAKRDFAFRDVPHLKNKSLSKLIYMKIWWYTLALQLLYARRHLKTNRAWNCT